MRVAQPMQTAPSRAARRPAEAILRRWRL
jgi:hypothetical protein